MLLELAENANTYTPLGPADERIVTDRYVLWMGREDGAGWNVAQRFRFEPGELGEVLDEIHAHLRAKRRTACSWEVGSHAEPPDLVDRLFELGVGDDETTELVVGMALTEPPDGPTTDVEVRRVQTGEEYLVSERIAAIAFEAPVPTELQQVYKPDPRNVVYLAYVDGEPVARASASFSERGVTLFGGSTLPEARGRGAYRALVQARWEDAVARGTPALVTQASPMSRPILARLGFREVCEIRIVIDILDDDAESGA